MNKKSTVTQLFLTTASFFGGLAVGMLLSPSSGKENRKRMQSHASKAADWITDHQNQIIGTGNRHFRKLRSRIRNRVNKNIPNLYHATEQIQFDES